MLNDKPHSPIRLRSIFFGILIALGFLCTVGLLGAAISSRAHMDELSAFSIVCAAICCVLILVASFIIAAYFACTMEACESIKRAILQTVASWAILALILGLTAFLATASVSLKDSFHPLLVTDMSILKTNAVTSLVLDSKQHNEEDDEGNKGILLVDLVGFFSLALGLGASVATGIVAFRLNDNRQRARRKN